MDRPAWWPVVVTGEIGMGWIASAPVRAPISEPWGTIVLVALAVFGGGVVAWVVLRLGWVLWRRWREWHRTR
jgi:hypothetical protein